MPSSLDPYFTGAAGWAGPLALLTACLLASELLLKSRQASAVLSAFALTVWALYCWLTYGPETAIWSSVFGYLALVGGWKLLDAREGESAARAAAPQHEVRRSEDESELETYGLEAVDASRIGRWYWDLENQRLQYSAVWLELAGLSPEEARGVPQEWYERIHPCDLGKFKDALSAHLYGSLPMLDCEYRYRRSDGSYRWMLTRGRAGRDADGRPLWLTGTQIDVTEIVDVERRSDDAQTDRLTGVLNRRALALLLDRACQDATERAGSLAVLALDLDGFRLVNDSLGMAVGDDTLAAVGKRLLDLCNGKAACGRQGGDEFAIVLEGLRDPAEALEAAQHVHAEMKRPFRIHKNEIQLSASIGVAVHGQAGGSPDELFRNAELALQRAKASGPRLATFDDNMRSRAVRTYSLRNELSRAAERAEFELHFQPIFQLSDGALVEAEALLRWRRSSGEVVSASEFISLAEETGMISELGEWAFKAACVARKNWVDAGYGDFRVAVNVSPLQLFREDFPDRVKRILAHTAVSPHLMKIELTESALVENLEVASDVLMALSALGFRLSVDDFGTGYSSLSNVTRFPFSTIKLDRSLLEDLSDDPRPQAVLRGIISLAHTLQMDVIAEGVETAEQLHWLLLNRCDRVQGYFLGRPIPGWEFSEGLRTGSIVKSEALMARVGAAKKAG